MKVILLSEIILNMFFTLISSFNSSFEPLFNSQWKFLKIELNSVEKVHKREIE